MTPIVRLASLLIILSLSTGCSIVLPEVSTMPVVHNPFPQLSRVAVAPFNNLSDEPKVDGRQFALAYYAELQSVPGFEVVPLGVVEEVMIDYNIRLDNPDQARKLGELLGVDAVVVGSVTDFSPYYPPRCGMRVDWYATNPGFHEIPAGYGLPWGTADEEYIPPKVVFEAEMALAKAQMATQSPVCESPEPPMLPSFDAAPLMPAVPEEFAAPREREGEFTQPPAADTVPGDAGTNDAPRTELLPPLPNDQGPLSRDGFDIEDDDPHDPLESNAGDATAWRPQQQVAYKVPLDPAHAPPAPDAIAMSGATAAAMQNNFAAQLPPDWPDPRGFIPPGPSPIRPECVENYGPVMTHTRIFLGHDPDFTAALAAYVDFRDDARFGGWRSYLERSDDFIRFCCHLHISEMLSARGGSTETRVVRRWSDCR